jgi:hypothetical protein
MWRRELVERVKTSFTWAMEQHPLRDLILNQEKERVKLNKGVIVKGEMVNRDELFMSTCNMKDIFQMKGTNQSGYNRITNVFNVHTLPISRPDLFTDIVAVMSCKPLEFTGVIVSGTRVKIPVGIGTLRSGRHACHLVIRNKIFIVPIPAVVCSMPGSRLALLL